MRDKYQVSSTTSLQPAYTGSGTSLLSIYGYTSLAGYG